MRLTIKSNDIIGTTLTCLNGVLRLTPTELKIANKLLDYKTRIGEAEPLSTDIRKKIQDELGMDKFTFANYIASLKKKHFIVNNSIPRMFVEAIKSPKVLIEFNIEHA